MRVPGKDQEESFGFKMTSEYATFSFHLLVSRRGKNDFLLPFPSPGDLPDPGIEPRSPTL